MQHACCVAVQLLHEAAVLVQADSELGGADPAELKRRWRAQQDDQEFPDEVLPPAPPLLLSLYGQPVGPELHARMLPCQWRHDLSCSGLTPTPPLLFSLDDVLSYTLRCSAVSGRSELRCSGWCMHDRATGWALTVWCRAITLRAADPLLTACDSLLLNYASACRRTDQQVCMPDGIFHVTRAATAVAALMHCTFPADQLGPCAD